jgi:zinc transport system permease protein
MGWIETLTLYFSQPFVLYVLIVGVMIALCSSLLGVTLVLKRFSFIGDGLSHVAFGAMAIAGILQAWLTHVTEDADGWGSIVGALKMPIVLVITILCAILLLRTGQNSKIKGDAAIGMLSVGALAVGYLLMNLFPTSANPSGDACTTLFGSHKILTVTSSEVWLCAVLAVVVVVLFVLFYNKLFAVTFDENFSQAIGMRVGLYNLMIAVVVAIIIVLAMNLVGSLLISALVIFPALSAMRIFRSFKSVTICAAIFSVLAAAIGIVVAILAETPVGATIVAVDIVGFLGCTVVGRVARGVRA